MEKIRSLAVEYYQSIGLFIVGIVILIGGSLGLDLSVFSPKQVSSHDVIVDIGGEVASPGVYKVKNGVNIGEAIKIAGGLTAEANQDFVSKSINLASVVTDGDKIYIPSYQEQASAKPDSTVNINTASQDQLNALPGVGEVTSSKIINQRPYGSIQDLLTRKIVSKSTYNKIENLITAY